MTASVAMRQSISLVVTCALMMIQKLRQGVCIGTKRFFALITRITASFLNLLARRLNRLRRFTQNQHLGVGVSNGIQQHHGIRGEMMAVVVRLVQETSRESSRMFKEIHSQDAEMSMQHVLVQRFGAEVRAGIIKTEFLGQWIQAGVLVCNYQTEFTN